MRDLTRGGLATVLNEFAQSAHVGIQIYEQSIPVCEEVQGVCELLGLDPLYLANEGKLVAIAPAAQAEAVVTAMRSDPAGRDSRILGYVVAASLGTVILQTRVGEQLPRIC
jgi:hydrogenase expression/formation protein HypE